MGFAPITKSEWRFISPMFRSRRGVNHDIRDLALSGRLEEAYQKAVICKVKYLQSKGIEPHPRTLEAYEAVLEE